MASVFVPNPYTFIFYNMNNNNNDKSSTPVSYPLVVTKPQTRSSTLASTNPKRTVTVVKERDNGSESNSQKTAQSLTSNNSYVELDQERNSEGESHISEGEGGAASPAGIMTEPERPVTRRRRGKNLLHTEVSSPTVDETETTPKPKPKGRRGRKKRGSFVDAPKKVPGTSLKICANCGTIADKVKAKKCHKCQKFFFDHWAKRCRIPPCPNCHFSRKSRGCEVVPQFCERCGHPLKGDATLESDQQASVGETSSVLAEGDSISDTSSFQLSEDFHDVDNLSQSRDSEDEDEDEESVHESVGSGVSHPLATDASKVDIDEYSGTCESPCKSHDLADNAGDTTGKSCDVTDESQSTQSCDLTTESSGSTGFKDEVEGEITNDKETNDITTNPDEMADVDPPPLVDDKSMLSDEKSIPVDNSSMPLDDNSMTVGDNSMPQDDKPMAADTDVSGLQVLDAFSCSNSLDSSDVNLAESLNPAVSEADLCESMDTADAMPSGPEVVDSNADTDFPDESASIKENANVSNVSSMEADCVVCEKQQLEEPPVDSTGDECLESPASDTSKPTNLAELAQPSEPTGGGGQEQPMLLEPQQDVSLERSHSAPILPTSHTEAKCLDIEDQASAEEVLNKDLANDTEQRVTANNTCLVLATSAAGEVLVEEQGSESSPSSVSLVSQQTTPACLDNEGMTSTLAAVKKQKRAVSPSPSKTKVKSAKKSSGKSVEKKSPKKKSKKKEAIESKRHPTPASTGAETPVPLTTAPPLLSIADGLTQQEAQRVNPSLPLPFIPSAPLIPSPEVDSAPGTSETQKKQSTTQLLHHTQKLGAPVTSNIHVAGLQPLLKNLVVQWEESQSNTPELLHQRLQSQVVESRLECREQQQQQQALINQQIKQSQQQCQQLINQLQCQVNQQQQMKAGTKMDLEGAQEGTPLSVSQLPQKRRVSDTDETTSKDGDLVPTSSKKLKTWPQTDIVDTTSMERTALKASPVLTEEPAAPSSPPVVEKLKQSAAQVVAQEKIAARAGFSSVIQSSSKLVPRSASLPPQLVPSSSLARQESDDDDVANSTFPLCSTPCLSHALPPPPLKPTPPSSGATAAVSLHPVMSRSPESLVSLPSLVSITPVPDLKLVSGRSLLLPPQSIGNLSQHSIAPVNVSTIIESRSQISGSESSVIMRAGPAGGLQMTGEAVSSLNGNTTGSNLTQSVVSSSSSVSLSPSPASGSFHKLELGSPPAISGQPNNIRVSLLKPEEDSSMSISNVDTCSIVGVQSPMDGSDGPPPPVGGPIAIGEKFQNFALASNLSVIATVETQASTTHSSQVSRLSPTSRENSSEPKLHHLKSNTQEPQKPLENYPSARASLDSSGQCTPEEIEEMSSNIQKRITSVLAGSNSSGSLTPVSVSQPQPPQLLPQQSHQPQVPALLTPIPSLPLPSRGGAVSVTVIKSATQSESNSLFSNAGVQTLNASAGKGPGPLGGNNPPGTLSSSAKLPISSSLVSLTSPLAQSKPFSQPSVSKDGTGLPSVGIQAAPTSNFRKIAPRKPGPSGIVTIQVCSTVPSSNSVTAAKMSSQSVGVGTEPSASQVAGVRMTPSILRPRPSAQIGGVLVTPQPSVGLMSSHLQTNGQGVLRKAAGGTSGDAHLFPCSPPGRSVYVTKLYSNVPTSAAQTGPQGYNPRTRSGLKELSSPAFEEALRSASKLNSKQVQEEEEKERPLKKKEKKKGGRVKTKEGGKTAVKSKKGKGKSQVDKDDSIPLDEGRVDVYLHVYTCLYSYIVYI